MLQAMETGKVHLLPGLFAERAEVNRAYLMELENQGLLQNFYLEAGIIMPGLQVVEDPETALLHWGWEAPTCQLRGLFRTLDVGGGKACCGDRGCGIKSKAHKDRG